MPKEPSQQFNTRVPDYIPEHLEHLYPAIGGVFHDYVPEGETALTMYGPTADADPVKKCGGDDEIKPSKEKKRA